MHMTINQKEFLIAKCMMDVPEILRLSFLLSKQTGQIDKIAPFKGFANYIIKLLEGVLSPLYSDEEQMSAAYLIKKLTPYTNNNLLISSVETFEKECLKTMWYYEETWENIKAFNKNELANWIADSLLQKNPTLLAFGFNSSKFFIIREAFFEEIGFYSAQVFMPTSHNQRLIKSVDDVESILRSKSEANEFNNLEQIKSEYLSWATSVNIKKHYKSNVRQWMNLYDRDYSGKTVDELLKGLK